MEREILKPYQPEVPQHQDNSGIPTEFLEAGINMKNMQFLDHLGLRDEMFNSEVMGKVDYIAERIDDLEMLQDLDMRLGKDMPAIDKIYSFLRMEDMKKEKYEQIELISNRQKDYERR